MTDSRASRDTEKRLRRLEMTFARLVGGAIVLGMVVLAFVGLASYHLIPRKVDDVIAKAISVEAEDVVEELKKLVNHSHDPSAELHIESGTVNVGHDRFKELRATNSHVGFRGAENERITFRRPFSNKPNVIVALTYIDHHLTDNGNVNINNLRIRAYVTSADRDGFNYSIGTWSNTDIYRTELAWIAYGMVEPNHNSNP